MIHDGAGVAASRRSWAGRLADLYWAWVFLVTLAVVSFRIGEPDLWRDELASWSAAGRSLPELLALAQNIDATSIVYYLVLHAWMAVFGDSAVAMRAPSALAIAAAAAVMACLVRVWYGRLQAVLAGLLFALLPVMSYFAQQARSYAFATLGTAVATWLLVRALQRPQWRRWVPYGVAVGATAMFHLVAAMVVAGHAVAVGAWFLLQRDRRMLRWLVAAPAGLMLALPVGVMAMRQHGDQLYWLTVKPGLRDLIQAPQSIVMSGLVAAAAVTLAAIGLFDNAKTTALGLGLTAAPILLIWLISQYSSYWFGRYLAFSLVGLVVLAATALARARPWAAVAVLGLVAVLGIDDQRAIRGPVSVGQGNVRYSEAIGWLGGQVRPGDARLYLQDDSWMAIDAALDYHGLGEERLRTVCRDKTGPQRDHLWGSPATDMPACLGDTARLWVVRPFDQREHPLAPAPAPLAGELQSRYERITVTVIGNLTLVLYERRG
ncbi:glycosyltransferase family 39 protein [Allorhizocola rhizosphaerae]|uniref:glycosyltransferase family 39 protein n=1 Tax=Allorhizocola rhizosphaerae TaxID=1872709 RepID=UPI000E3E2B21|nr:glycosyltransferase family 39 protein [Allorhizocola rhizosphaerae]